MRRLLLFAKRPILGQVKTRLVPPLGPEQVLEFYRALLSDQLRFLRSFGSSAELELCLDGPWDPATILPAWVEGLNLTEQGPGDLGERLMRAFARSRLAGATGTIVIGVDSPTLPGERVQYAFERLEAGAIAVVGPAEDGGYVLIGLREPLPALFHGVPWGTDRVLEATRERATATGVRLVELEPWYDVDDTLGLERLRRELAAPHAAERASATARFLGMLDAASPPVL